MSSLKSNSSSSEISVDSGTHKNEIIKLKKIKGDNTASNIIMKSTPFSIKYQPNSTSPVDSHISNNTMQNRTANAGLLSIENTKKSVILNPQALASNKPQG